MVQAEGEKDILGVMQLLEFAPEEKIEIKLLAVSKENYGKDKLHEGIASSLIAYACREAVKNFGEYACVSLVPKTKLKQHYIDMYGMIDAGLQVYLDGKPLRSMIKKYKL